MKANWYPLIILVFLPFFSVRGAKNSLNACTPFLSPPEIGSETHLIFAINTTGLFFPDHLRYFYEKFQSELLNKLKELDPTTPVEMREIPLKQVTSKSEKPSLQFQGEEFNRSNPLPFNSLPLPFFEDNPGKIFSFPAIAPISSVTVHLQIKHSLGQMGLIEISTPWIKGKKGKKSLSFFLSNKIYIDFALFSPQGTLLHLDSFENQWDLNFKMEEFFNLLLKKKLFFFPR